MTEETKLWPAWIAVWGWVALYLIACYERNLYEAILCVSGLSWTAMYIGKVKGYV